MKGVGIVTVPVNTGDASGAYAVLVYAFVPNVPPVPTFIVEPSVPVNVNVFEAVRVLPAPNVSVPVPVVMVLPLMLVAVAAPRLGVTNVGLVLNTARPVPVSSDNTPANWADVVEPNWLKLPVVAKVPDVGKVTLVAPVDVRVVLKDPDVFKDEPSAKAKVADVAGAVIVSLFNEVAVATPKAGVTKIGLVSVLLVSVCASVVPTIVPAGAFCPSN